jgi:hypothetical protein
MNCGSAAKRGNDVRTRRRNRRDAGKRRVNRKERRERIEEKARPNPNGKGGLTAKDSKHAKGDREHGVLTSDL